MEECYIQQSCSLTKSRNTSQIVAETRSHNALNICIGTPFPLTRKVFANIHSQKRIVFCEYSQLENPRSTCTTGFNKHSINKCLPQNGDSKFKTMVKNSISLRNNSRYLTSNFQVFFQVIIFFSGQGFLKIKFLHISCYFEPAPLFRVVLPVIFFKRNDLLN